MRWQLEGGERQRPFTNLIFTTFVVLLPLVLASSPKIFGDGDVSWHVATGQWILAHHRIPHADPFSFTMTGMPWTAFEWLSECIYAIAYNAAGYRGLAAVVMVALVAAHFVTFGFLARRVQPLAMVAAFAAMDLLLSPFLLARPHVLVWPLVAIWTAMLLECREKNRAPPLSIALVMFLWANLHGSFMLGFVILGAFALDALIARRNVLGWLNFGLAALILALLNANGLTGFLHPVRVMGLQNLALIDEWQPSTLQSFPLFYGVVIATLAAIVLKRPRLTIGEILLLLFMTAMAFMQARHQSWFAIVAPLILAPKLAGVSNEQAEAKVRTARIAFAAVATLLAVLIVPALPKESAGNPRSLLAHVPAELRNRPVLNGYSFGGPLILAGIRPYIDGRSDMYGDPFVIDYFEMMRGDQKRFDAAVRKYGIGWTMLTPATGLVRVLDASPDWERIYSDKIGVIHVRRSAVRG